MAIKGKWENELGSIMKLKSGKDGVIKGTYHSPKAGNDSKPEPLQGLTRDGKDDTYVGWVVCFSSTKEPKKDPAVCTWSGRYFEADGKETIETTWLLTVASDETGKWDNTLIGKDTFTRAK